MPRARLTKSAIDALPTPSSELVYWDETLPGFGVKVTPAGRKVFIVLYRTAGAGLAPSQVHHRTLWPGDASRRPQRGPAGARGPNRGTRSGWREARGQTS